MKKLVIAALIIMSSPALAAYGVANDMTCAQTKAYSASHGRVYVRTWNGDVIPVYGYNDACRSDEREVNYWVKTLDTNRCVIGHRCESRR